MCLCWNYELFCIVFTWRRSGENTEETKEDREERKRERQGLNIRENKSVNMRATFLLQLSCRKYHSVTTQTSSLFTFTSTHLPNQHLP